MSGDVGDDGISSRDNQGANSKQEDGEKEKEIRTNQMQVIDIMIGESNGKWGCVFVCAQ